MQQTLASLALALPKQKPPSPAAARISSNTFKFEANALGLQSVSFAFRKDGCAVTFKDAKTSHPIACGSGRWQRGEIALPGTPPRLITGGAPRAGTRHKLAASGTWKDDNTFEMVWRYYETPHHDTVTCRFDGDKVAIEMVASINSPKRPVLKGRLG